MIEARETIDRTVIAGLYSPEDELEPDLMLDELASLVEAAGGSVVGRTYQRRARVQGQNKRKANADPMEQASSRASTSAGVGADAGANANADDRSRVAISPSTFVGRGKAEHIAELVSAHEATVVAFDNELMPAQIRELERIIGCRVLDRSEIILDIFAGRARTREAKLQVELAQLEYTAPRLRGMWSHLERQAGTGGGSPGIGLRGPGEKQIEIDRRLVRQRITRLKNELAQLFGRKQREVSQRTDKHFCVGLVGYTNAGKSTLMNALTSAGTLSADQLFATLDTKTRKWQVTRSAAVMLSDTVGFVRDLPHSLVASFRATLEEALHADLLLHVIDASHPQALAQIATVERVLEELGCPLTRLLCVLNKADAITDHEDLAILRARVGESVLVSARTGEGLAELADRVSARYRESCVNVHVRAPAASGRLQAYVRAHGRIESESHDHEGWTADIEIPEVHRAALPALCPEAVFDPPLEP